MGGYLNVAARFNDGETICVEGYTNFLTSMIVNPTTLSGDDSLVRSSLLEVAKHEDFKGPCKFQKSGYGIVVIDFIEKSIHSLQGYTSFTDKSLIQLLDINATGWKGNVFEHKLNPDLEILLDMGKIDILEYNGVSRQPLTKDTALTLLQEDHNGFMDGSGRQFYFIRINTDPFTVFEYDEDDSLLAMKVRLKSGGFPITKSEGLNTMFES